MGAAVRGQITPEEKDVTPPSITKPLTPENMFKKSGATFTLECSAEAIPDPTYKWYKLQGTSGNMDVVQPTDLMTLDSTTGVLNFLGFNKGQEGDYMCVASIVYTSVQSGRQEASSFAPVISVMIWDIQPFDQSIPQDTTHPGKEYAYMKLPCSGRTASQGPSQLSWYTTQEDGNQVQLKMDDPRLHMDMEGTLHFTYLKRSDASGEAGAYKCAQGDTVSVIYTGAENTLNVELVASSTATMPSIAYRSPPQKVERFSKEAHMECVFIGYDPKDINNHLPVIHWFDHSYSPIINNDKYKMSEDGRRLTVLNIQEEDTGDFHCLGENTEGKSRKEAVSIQVVSSPIWITKDHRPIDVVSPEGEDVIFKCEARSAVGDTEPNLPVWYINGKRAGAHLGNKTGNVTPVASKYQFSNNNKQLKVTSVSKHSDVLCVQCMVSNDVGQTWGDGCLSVIEPITIVSQPDLFQKIEHGDIVNLTIQVEVDPSYVDKLKYEWKLNNMTYKDFTPMMVYNVSTKEAYINTSTLTQDEYNEIGGRYERRIYHEHDELIVIIDVEIQDPQPDAVVQSAGFDMWILGLIVGILFLIVVIIIIVFIICRKQQEGDYNVDKKETGAGLDPEKELKTKQFDDYSRPEDYDDYQPYSDSKPRGDLEYDDVPIGGDDESLGEYGGEETYFNEDGSFIGIYDEKKGKKQRQNGHANESAI